MRSLYPNAASRNVSAFFSGQSKCFRTALSSTFKTKTGITRICSEGKIYRLCIHDNQLIKDKVIGQKASENNIYILFKFFNLILVWGNIRILLKSLGVYLGTQIQFVIGIGGLNSQFFCLDTNNSLVFGIELAIPDFPIPQQALKFSGRIRAWFKQVRVRHGDAGKDECFIYLKFIWIFYISLSSTCISQVFLHATWNCLPLIDSLY